MSGLILWQLFVVSIAFGATVPKLDDIDESIRQLYLYGNKLKGQPGGAGRDFRTLLYDRALACKKNEDLCFKKINWLPLACGGRQLGPEVYEGWKLLVSPISTSSAGKMLFEKLKACSAKESDVRLSLAIELYRQVKGKNRELAAQIAHWIRTTWIQAPSDMDTYIGTVTALIADSYNTPPVSVSALTDLIETTVTWMKQKPLEDSKALQIIAWLTQVRYYSILTGNEVFYTDVLKLYKNDFARIDLNWALTNWGILCSPMREHRNDSACTASLALLKGSINNAEGPLLVLFKEAMLALEGGEYKDAEMKLRRLLTAPANVRPRWMQPWVDYFLCVLDMESGHLDEAQKHLDEHERLVKSVGGSPLNVWDTRFLHTMVLYESGKWSEAAAYAAKINVDLHKSYDGPVQNMVWLAVHQLLIAGAMGNKVEIEAKEQNLRKAINDLPTLRPILSVITAMDHALVGKYSRADLKPMEKTLGPKYPFMLLLDRNLVKINARSAKRS